MGGGRLPRFHGQLDDPRCRPRLSLDDVNAGSDPMGPVVWRGILLNVLNPKLILFYFAFLPQFLDASPGLLEARLILLGGVFMFMTLAVFAVYALASADARDLILAALPARRWIERTLGAFLIGFAAKFALTAGELRRPPASNLPRLASYQRQGGTESWMIYPTNPTLE